MIFITAILISFLGVCVNARCPPLDVIGKCECKSGSKFGSYILLCDGELPKAPVKNLEVNEIFIKNLKENTQIDFNFKIKPTKIHLENNPKLNNIKTLIENNSELTNLVLIDNSADLTKEKVLNLLNKASLNEIHIRQTSEFNLKLLNGFNNLKSIIVASCGITTIPDINFKSMIQLKYLDLSNNQITVISPKSLVFNSKGLNLILTGNNLKELVNNGKLMESEIDMNKNGLTVHLENNHIDDISKFGKFVTNNVTVHLDNNEINCKYDQIKLILNNPAARNLLLDVFCKNYQNQNLFEIKHFNDQPYPTIKPDDKKCGKVNVKVLNGSFTSEGPAFVALCFNDDTDKPDDCHLCAQNLTKSKNHDFTDTECNKNPSKNYSDKLNLIFGISSTNVNIKDVKEVIGLPTISIKEDIIDAKKSDIPIQLKFNEDQYITVNVKWDENKEPC